MFIFLLSFLSCSYAFNDNNYAIERNNVININSENDKFNNKEEIKFSQKASVIIDNPGGDKKKNIGDELVLNLDNDYLKKDIPLENPFWNKFGVYGWCTIERVCQLASALCGFTAIFSSVASVFEGDTYSKTWSKVNLASTIAAPSLLGISKYANNMKTIRAKSYEKSISLIDEKQKRAILIAENNRIESRQREINKELIMQDFIDQNYEIKLEKEAIYLMQIKQEIEAKIKDLDKE